MSAAPSTESRPTSRPGAPRDGALHVRGGDRAALFHLGALRRLNELGVLSKIDTSRRSRAGASSPRSSRPGSPEPSASREARRRLRGRSCEAHARVRRAGRPHRGGPGPAHPRNWLTPGARSKALAAAYAQGPAPGRLDDLPEAPRFVFLASDMRFRDQWVFDTGERHVGSRPAATRRSATGRSRRRWPRRPASRRLRRRPHEVGAGGTHRRHVREPDRDRLVREIDLSDGGMFDNLGLEPVWRDHETVLVSDAAPSFKPDPDVGWLWSALRQGVILLEQATEVRKRWLVANFIEEKMQGAYWGIASRPASYELEPAPQAYTEKLIRDFIAPIRIDLDVFSAGRDRRPREPRLPDGRDRPPQAREGNRRGRPAERGPPREWLDEKRRTLPTAARRGSSSARVRP